jgi:hypothetical protein
VFRAEGMNAVVTDIGREEQQPDERELDAVAWNLLKPVKVGYARVRTRRSLFRLIASSSASRRQYVGFLTFTHPRSPGR